MQEILAKRLSAKLLDITLIKIFALYIELKLPNLAKFHIFFLLFVAYEVILIQTLNSTIGKHLFNLQIINTDKTKLSFLKNISRSILSLVSIYVLGLGVIYAFFEKQKRAAHDRILGTQIVNAE